MCNPTNQPSPEGVDACKGGGGGDQKTIGPAQAKTEEEGHAHEKGGVQPFQTDPKLQLSDNQPRALSFEKTRRQCRPTYRMALKRGVVAQW